jgi:hypothetical protein
MSAIFKMNTALMSILLSSLGTAGYITWLASSKASAIDTAREEIRHLQESDKQQSAVLNRLDERSLMILETLRRFEKEK